MTRASQAALIAAAMCGTLFATSLAIYGLTSKVYLEHYIVLQESSGRVPLQNVWLSTKDIQSDSGRDGEMKVSPPRSIPPIPRADPSYMIA
jgi:hypothetical protein